MINPFSPIKLILMLGCIFSFFTASAQDYYQGPQPPKNKSYKDDQPSINISGFSIALSLGAAIPFKSFSSTNVKNSFWDFNSSDSTKLQGFAKPGTNINVTASYLFPNSMGIRLMIGSNSNPFDISTFTSTVGVPFTSTDAFHTREYLIGPYISFSQGPKLKFEADAMIGLVTANYPSVAFSIVDTTETFSFNAGKSFGYSFGGAVKYSITEQLDIAINASYTQASMTYPGWTDTFTAPGYYPYVRQHTSDITNMPMGILKITAGIVFNFK